MNWRKLTAIGALMGGFWLVGCPEDSSCPSDKEICDDDIDNDCDGLIDKKDPDCPKCTSEICNDSEDNDCDGKVDEDDDDCDLGCSPSGATETVCNDGVDDDCDGAIDTDDTDCPATPMCDPPGSPDGCYKCFELATANPCTDKPTCAASEPLYMALTACTCAGACMDACKDSVCAGMDPSAGCQACVTTMGCATEFGACSADAP